VDWSVERKPEGPLREFARNNMISMNPPQHTRFRQSAARGLSRKASAAMATKIESLVDKLLDDMSKKDGGDFITDFAFPLPVYVICELLGISHEDHDMFGQCTADMLASLEMSASEEVFDRGSAAANILFDYCKAVAADREKAPRDDLISMLIDKEREDKMSRDELIWLTITMLIAGHETTTHMLGNGMLALVRHPGQYELLANNPGLSAGATEEILRYDPTLYVLFRESIVDVQMGGYNIPAGSFLLSSLYGANHDPEVFDGPDCFDIRRANANMHLTFAAGRNLCLGHWLARLEGEIAFARIFKKIKNFQMTGNPLPRNGLMFRGHFSLPMSWQAIV
tara:strand:+ start:207847 stop:208863 length:1017 start_codon:yes stop_codon:yes gene_type:complete